MSPLIKTRLRLIDLCGVTVLLVLLSSSLALGVYPLSRRGAEAVRQTEAIRQELSQLDGLSKTLAQVDAERKQTEARLVEAESRLPNSKAMDQFMQQLAKVADDVGLRVDGITPKQLKDAGDYKAMPVEINGTGDWNTCYKFLTGLRSMNRLTRLDALVLDVDRNAKSGSDDETVVRIRVNISTFMAR